MNLIGFVQKLMISILWHQFFKAFWGSYKKDRAGHNILVLSYFLRSSDEKALFLASFSSVWTQNLSCFVLQCNAFQNKVQGLTRFKIWSSLPSLFSLRRRTNIYYSSETWLHSLFNVLEANEMSLTAQLLFQCVLSSQHRVSIHLFKRLAVISCLTNSQFCITERKIE